MKSSDIIDALDMLNNDIIEEADKMRMSEPKHKIAWHKWLSVAACFAIVIAVSVGFLKLQKKPVSTLHPILTIMQISNSGEGFEGIMAYDISEIANNNPWAEENNFVSLPIYKNTFEYDENSYNQWSIAEYPEELHELIIDTAKRFKIDVKTLTFSDDAPSDEERKAYAAKCAALGEDVICGLCEPTVMIAENDEIKITANVSMTVTVTFKNSVNLPDEYSLSDYSACVKTAKYLKNEYKDIIAMRKPVIDVYGGDCNIDGERGKYSIRFFESDNDSEKEFINYSFFGVEFVFDDEENLAWISFQNSDLSQMFGEYPIITAEKAKELLKNGDYISDVPYDFPGIEYLAKTELIYYTDMKTEFFMPYYKFYVELPSLIKDNGIKTYGIYYVPAVEGKYIQK